MKILNYDHHVKIFLHNIIKICSYQITNRTNMKPYHNIAQLCLSINKLIKVAFNLNCPDKAVFNLNSPVLSILII